MFLHFIIEKYAKKMHLLAAQYFVSRTYDLYLYGLSYHRELKNYILYTLYLDQVVPRIINSKEDGAAGQSGQLRVGQLILTVEGTETRGNISISKY